jgi:hypothetical protein
MSDNPAYYPEAIVPQEPAGDWTNWYGTNITDNIGAGPERMGQLPAYREEPLQPPYIVWDSRTITTEDMDFGNETGFIENLGSGGDHFNLKLGGQYNEEGEPVGQAFPYEYVYGYKTQNWDNTYGTTVDPPGGFPTDVSEIGGDTCEGAYTMMIAISPLWKHVDEWATEFIARGATNYDGYQYIEMEFLSNNDVADGGGASIVQNVLGDNNEGAPDTNLTTEVFWEWYDAANYSQWLQQSPSPTYPDLRQPFAGKLITFVADPWMGHTMVYIDEDLVQIYDTSSEYEPPGWSANQFTDITWQADCSRQDATMLDTSHFHETFQYFYGHSSGRGGSFYRDNTAWNSAVGVAFFRGMPSKADIREWKEYFLPAAGQAYQTWGLQYNVTRAALANTAAHSEVWVVPNTPLDPENGRYPMDHVVLQLQHARGGQTLDAVSNNIYAKFDVSPGDEITFELGGGGANARTTGLGGWPDGGNGGLGSVSGLYGGGGAGSTRIYLNGVLYIVMPGSGGGATNSLGGGAVNVTDSSGERISAPDHEGLSGIDPVPGSSGFESNKGQPGTTVAPGAGGIGGGTAGVGSQGGTGTTTAAVGTHTGGGGGGGGAFGGGGGGAGSGQTLGGGAGSWFKHANVTLFDSNPSSVTAGSPISAGSPASVQVFYW